jgi:RNA polymerase sigma factor for flagellar operon FliA
MQPDRALEEGRLTPEQQALVLKYEPLVRRVARSLPLHIPALLEYEDAVSFGTCGLIEAVRRYDRDQDASFAAYASRRIRGAIIDAFRRLDWQTRTMRQRTRELQQAETELEHALGRTVTDQEIAAHMGVDIGQVRDVRATGRWVTVSLNRLLDADADSEGYRAAERSQVEEETDITDEYDEEELRRDLVRAVGALGEREQIIVQLYYVEQLSMREVASVLGVSETRVSQLHARAIDRLRRTLAAQRPD